jgi:hypothetical protein
LVRRREDEDDEAGKRQLAQAAHVVAVLLVV